MIFLSLVLNAPGPVSSWNLKNGVIRIFFDYVLDQTNPTAAAFSTSGAVSGTATAAQINKHYMNITFPNFDDRNSQSLTYDPKKATIPLKSSTGELVEAFTIKPNTKRYSLKSDQYEAEVVERVNQLRASLGLGKLRVAANISMMARIKADDMAVNNYFNHTSPIFGNFSTYIQFCEMPSSYAGENIAAGYSTPEKVYNGWFNSKGHYANMVNTNYAHIGVGYNEDSQWVQEFGFYKGSAQILITDMKGNPKVNTAITLGDPKDFAANQTFTTDASGKFTAKSILFDSWEVYVSLTLYTDVKIEINADTGSIVQTIKLNPKSSVKTGPNTALAIGLSIFSIIVVGALLAVLCMYAMKKKIWCFKTSASKDSIQRDSTQVVKYDLSSKPKAQIKPASDTQVTKEVIVQKIQKPNGTVTKTTTTTVNKVQVVPSSGQKQNFNEIKAKFATQTKGGYL
ncbi:SCP-like_extracellular protein [Hexamita inflata]|uniref:SCP-like extracellular protein n=1 Tax=Hexamita inflata TaxID=28002 RepID=A0AA86TCG6_9EUKA|nr:SCP-like extracellular protein [Hexamita inflata]